MKHLLFVLFILFSITTFSQKYTISGYVTDNSSGEKLIGANIYDALTLKGCISNNYGFYSLTLPAGDILITFSYVGYNQSQQKIKLFKDTVINFGFSSIIKLEEVEIVGNRFGSTVKSSQMSFSEIPIKDVKALPVLLGEADIIKTIALLPGVQSGTEGTSGMYVRGGGPDQNLILLDGVPVYNVNHLFGFFSVFNPTAIQNISLIKGGFPARYGA